MLVTHENGLYSVDRFFNFLAYTLPDWWFVDVARLIFVVIAAITACLCYRIWRSHQFIVFAGGAMACLGLALLELEQLGNRFVPWRLPIFWVAVLLIARGTKRVFREW